MGTITPGFAPERAGFSLLRGLFRRQDVNHFDGRSGRKQLFGVGHEGGGYFAPKVGFAAGVFGKRIENTERGGAQLDAVPGHGIRLFHDEGQPAAQEIGHGAGILDMALDPQGPGKLSADKAIPVDRTTTPFDVTTAFIGLAQTIEDIDTKQLATAFNTLSDTFKDTPDSVRSSLTGLQRLSTTIASRDTQVRSLLQHAKGVTGVLASRNTEVVKLIDDGDLLLKMVEQQRAVIHDLLVNTANLADQLTKLVAENRSKLGPALTNLKRTLAILNDQQVHLDRTIHLLAPFVRDFTNTLGNGRWFDTFIANLPGAVLKPEPAQAAAGATK